MDKAWTSARHLPTPLPTLAALATTSSPLQQQDLGDHNHGRLRRHRVRQDPRSSPPPPIPHCTVTRARLRSQPPGQTRLQPRENQHRIPGREKRLRVRSEHTGIAVKSRTNPGQVLQDSPSSAQESAIQALVLPLTPSCPPPRGWYPEGRLRAEIGPLVTRSQSSPPSRSLESQSDP